MFVRRLKSKNGRLYVQVVSKTAGRYQVLKSFGGSDNQEEIIKKVSQAKNWIKIYSGSQEFDFAGTDQLFEQLFGSISNIRRVGWHYLLGGIFDQIGFDAIEDDIFKYLVIGRIAYPRSKLKTTEYLMRYHQLDLSEDQVYRYMDKLRNKHQEDVQRISFEHTKKILGGKIGVVFYDVTTLYFEIDLEDDLRKTGFSKEGKHQHPQIVLGLLVSSNAYPLAYEIFEGNKFEGHTMLPVVEAFREKYGLQQPVVVADSGLMSKANIEALQLGGYEFIIGARIKNEAQPIKERILSLQLENGKSATIKKGDMRLIITYSDDRARKDKYNREKGLSKLEKRIQSGRITKSSINNRGYNKFLKMEGEITVSLDRDKLHEEAKWDGLKGYLTNATLSKNNVIENYQHLWQIEKAFRVAKSELKIRPIYHRLPRRIMAHICISFVAYKVYKELERQLDELNAGLSTQKAIEIAENIVEIEATLPMSKKIIRKTLLNDEEQKYLASLFGFGC